MQVEVQCRGFECMPSPTAEVGVAAHIAEVGPGGNAGPRGNAEHADWACRRALGFERGGVNPAARPGRRAARGRAPPGSRAPTPPLPTSMPTRTDCAALRAHRPHHGGRPRLLAARRQRSDHGLHAGCRTCRSAGVLSHHHQPITSDCTPPQLAADILVPVALQEAAGPCKGGVMTGGLVLCTRARAPFGGHGLSHTVGRERCSRWRLLACGWACVVCHLSTVSECTALSLRPQLEVRDLSLLLTYLL